MGYQNLFATRLGTDIGASDTTITLETVPSVTSGRLTLEARNATQREIIKYTGVAGNTITGVTRGQGGTTAKTHLKNALVEMNATAEDFQDLLDAFNSFAASANDWRSTVNLPVTTTYLGNRSYQHVYGSSIAAIKSVGMRNKYTKTVASNTYMGGLLDGSTKYFTKVTPTGTLSTVTDNFTILAMVRPTAYNATGANGYIAGRFDAAQNNGFGIVMDAQGTLTIIIRNGGNANFRYLTTVQALSLNKTTTVVATWASGTVNIYFDGLSVPLQTVGTGGTAPTVTGTGGDWSIGRCGAASASYFNGYISNVAIFNAVLSAATIKSYNTYKLTGSETSCIGAWSLDNVLTDATGTNTLVAGGSAGFTSLSPMGTLADGTPSANTSFSITTAISSDGLTETVQVPEGCTLPTTGGISAMSYSGVKAPYQFPTQEERWLIETRVNIYVASAALTSQTWAAILANFGIVIPTGAWAYGYRGGIQFNAGSTVSVSGHVCLATAAPAFAVYSEKVASWDYDGATQFLGGHHTAQGEATVSTATQYILYAAWDQGSAVFTTAIRGDLGSFTIYARLTLL